MSDDDDDFDEYLDDGDEEEEGIDSGLGLVVCARPPKGEMLNQLEEQYRRVGFPPVMFVETDDAGNEIFGNAAEFAKLMNLPAEAPLPTVAEADTWIEAQNWPRWEW